MKTRSLFGILCVSIATLTAQSSIVHVNGPSFPASDFWGWNPAHLDMNSDGTVDFSFWSSGMLCTTDVPSSGCGWPFYVSTASTNEVLTSGSDVSPRLLGELIETQAPPTVIWIVPGGFYGAGISYWWYSHYGREIGGQLLHSGWSGGVGERGVGYLGVKFFTSDGLHYGWIRVRLPQPATATAWEAVPYVVDWAYETQPNTPLRAGDIGTDSDSVQFKVEFFDVARKHRRLKTVSGNGSLILTDSRLRCELHLAGDFSAAEIQGPANPRSHGNAKPDWDFPPPLVRGTNHTAFFGEATLTRAQLLQLARGQLYIRIDDGDVVGRITPVEDDKKRKR